jgi:hypothetical protein
MEHHKKIICVLGMHRSGTSALTRVLNLLGVYLGKEEELLPATQDNPEGFWEYIDIVGVHDQILNLFHSSWDSIPLIPKNRLLNHELIPLKNQLKEMVTRQFEDHDIWGFKDPRTCLFVPLWLELSQELGIPIEFIHVFRNPIEVADSLTKRNGFSRHKGLALWYIYSLHEYFHTLSTRSIRLGYDHLVNLEPATLTTLAEQLVLNTPDETTLDAIQDFLRPSLRHYTASDSAELNKHSTIHELFQLISGNCNHDQFQEQITLLYREALLPPNG